MYRPLLCALLLLPFAASAVSALDEARKEMGVDRARSEFGATGRGVLVAVIDRGLDYEHAAFRTPSGSTRLEALFDLTDDAGAEQEDNPYGFGTIYERGQIDSALLTKKPLKPNDDEGRGTCNAGIVCGNGLGSPEGRYRGIAPQATLLFVKIKLDRAKETEPEGGEVEFFELRRLRIAMEFCAARAKKLGMPCVVLLNFGQPGGPTDGRSKLCRTIDEMFGPGIPGLVLVSGPGDNGDRKNRAGGMLSQGGTLALPVVKEAEGEVIVDIWYPAEDRFSVRIKTPGGSFGPYAPPKTGASEYHKEFQYYQLASTRNLNLAKDAKRQIRVDLIGPPGKYVIHLIGTKVKSGRFDAFIGPNCENPMVDPFDRFEAHLRPGSLWDGASAKNVICPGSYVGRLEWKNYQGREKEMMAEGDLGAIWRGSGTGPTADGRHGITLCAPGDRIISTYGSKAEWAEMHGHVVCKNGDPYGIMSGTTASAALVAGVVALMLQRDPGLDAAQVKKILEETARKDRHTGVVPNAVWGYGKIDAYAALDRVTPNENAKRRAEKKAKK